jgi:hypothetical protein
MRPLGWPQVFTRNGGRGVAGEAVFSLLLDSRLKGVD